MIDHIWQDFLRIAVAELGSRAVETWIKAVSFARYDKDKSVLYFKAPNAFVKDWVQSHYLQFFEIHFRRFLQVDVLRVCFVIGDDQQESELIDSSARLIEKKPAIIKKQKAHYKAAKKLVPYQQMNRLNHLYTFDSFVVGQNNSFAYAAARAIVDKLGKLYNPLLFYGGAGLGKTHLLHAIGNDVIAQDPSAVVVYQTTDRFINEFINAIRFNHVQKFQAKYKRADVLLIDDIQFMANKEQTQEAFFHLFNHLYDANKQIILSSDTMPRELGGLADRLRSRLEWGLVADVQVPSLETKIAILKEKAALQNEILADEAAVFIAQCAVSNVRELEGALIRVLAFASLTNQQVTIELVKKVLGHEKHTVGSNVEFDQVIHVVKSNFSYGLSDLRSKNRSKDISIVRQIAMYLMKHATNKSLREIGEFLSRKDHTTVAHAIQKIEQMRQDQSDFNIKLERLERELYQR